MNTLNLHLLCAALALLGCTTAAAQESPWLSFKAPGETPLAEADWKGLEEGAVIVKLFDEPNTEVKRAEAVAILDFPAEEVFETVCDVANFPDFMPYVSEVAILEAREEKQRARFKLDLPWPVGNRHYVLSLEEKVDSTPLGTVYTSAWDYEVGSGNIIHTEGAWVITAFEDGRSFLHYICFTDTGGKIPVWLRNKATDSGIPKVVNQLRKSIKKRQEEQAP